jgi:hypothetical protein
MGGRRYTPVTMRRWLVAVLSLHLFLSVGVFASGHAHARATAPDSAEHHLLAEAEVPVSAALDSATPGQAPEHGPTDLLTDLPECLDAPIVASGRSEALHTLPPPLAHDLTPPALDGPQRPPRGLPHRA